jgi:hypothetical protein
MDSIEFLLELLAGSVFLLGCGYLVGHLLRLDKFSDDRQQRKDFHLRNTDGLMEEQSAFTHDKEFQDSKIR